MVFRAIVVRSNSRRTAGAFLLTLDRAARRTSVVAGARARLRARRPVRGHVVADAVSFPRVRAPVGRSAKAPSGVVVGGRARPARRARARAADYDGWLADAKAKWRTLRKKMAVPRNFVKTERDGGATAIAMVRDPLADLFGASDAARLDARRRDRRRDRRGDGRRRQRRHRGLGRHATPRGPDAMEARQAREDVKLGDGLRLQRALVALARAAANAPPHARNARATSLMVTAMGLPDAPRRDDEDDEDEDEDDAREATAAERMTATGTPRRRRRSTRLRGRRDERGGDG